MLDKTHVLAAALLCLSCEAELKTSEAVSPRSDAALDGPTATPAPSDALLDARTGAGHDASSTTDAAQTDGRPASPSDAQAPTADRGVAPTVDAMPAAPTDAAPPRPPVTAHNPVLPGDHPDPHVLRLEDSPPGEGPLYVLTHTVDNGDFPAFTSRDLATWAPQPGGLFGRVPARGGDSVLLGDHHYCHLWAPELAQTGGGYMLNFTATRFAAPQSPCPPYREDSGVYLASSAGIFGPYARAEHPWEPLPAGGQISNCGLRDQLPRSVDTAVDDCLGGFCHQVIRLDSTVFADPDTGRWWLAYAWYTNDPPRVDWERAHHGEHVSLVELDAADPYAVRCDAGVPQIHAIDPHDGALRDQLAGACPECGDMLAFDRGRQGAPMNRAGSSWGVAEGPSLIRANGLVYLFFSGSAWDSAWYHVGWVAAPTVEGLAIGAPGRLAGRLLIPGDGQAFGHGTPVLGPNGRDWYYLHHRLRADDCRDRGDCARDVWLSPLEFEDRGDGRGAVWVRPLRPAQVLDVAVSQAD